MEKTMSMKEQVMAMMQEKMDELTIEWHDAKQIFADIMLDDNSDYRCRDSRRLKCTNLGAQVELLKSMIDKVSMMSCEVMLPPITKI